ncbi:MAG TPA: hypothetical protein VKB79_14280 [Bryobacteraceae bacterium]|nr:hypothetical protein [Bryobacteraceae bacterium]
MKLRDRRVVDAMLPDSADLAPSALTAAYSMGDEVEIVCRQIQPQWEEATSRVQSLEVVSMRLLRKLSPAEVRGLLEARPREGINLLQGSESPGFEQTRSETPATQGSRELEHARSVNLAQLAHMPNFVADEVAKRYRSGSATGPLRPYDTVESEIAFQGRRAVRTQIKRNGQAWDQPFDALPGYKWYEGFETEIGPLFDPQCPTRIEHHGRSTVNGRPVLDYRFHSPVDGCFPFLYFSYERYNPARSGRFVIEDPGGRVIEVEDRSDQFPAPFQFQAREEHVTWDYVRIGESSHLLPVRADFAATYRSGTRYRVDIEYRNHRHFEASSNVTFQ